MRKVRGKAGDTDVLVYPEKLDNVRPRKGEVAMRVDPKGAYSAVWYVGKEADVVKAIAAQRLEADGVRRPPAPRKREAYVRGKAGFYRKIRKMRKEERLGPVMPENPVSAPEAVETPADIKALRLSLEETQVEFAARLGITRSRLAMWETGKAPFDPTVFDDALREVS